MSLLAQIATGGVAALHAYFLVLEMVLWESPAGHGFLAAGLVWGLLQGTGGRDVVLFFLACVLIAGLYGGTTFSRKIFVVQALPAAIALALVLAS